MVTSYQWLSIHKIIFPLAPTCLIFTEWNSWFERICRRPKQVFCFGFTTKISYEMPLQATLKRWSTRMRIASYKLIISLTCITLVYFYLFLKEIQRLAAGKLIKFLTILISCVIGSYPLDLEIGANLWFGHFPAKCK